MRECFFTIMYGEFWTSNEDYLLEMDGSEFFETFSFFKNEKYLMYLNNDGNNI